MGWGGGSKGREDRWVGRRLCGRREGGFHGEGDRLLAGGENGKKEKKKKSKRVKFPFMLFENQTSLMLAQQ